MAIERKEIETALSRRYTAGFVTDIESDAQRVHGQVEASRCRR